MAKWSAPIFVLFLYLILAASPPPSDAAVSYAQLRSLISLGHSLSTRVANLRASRGDIDGARRVRLIADKLEGGLGFRFWPTFWSLGWDYVKNYAWQDMASFRDSFSIASDFNELLSSLTELTRMRSDSERAAWVAQNYRRVLGLSNSMFNRLLSVFSKSGAVRDMVEILQREMVDGAYLKDCLEVGANDLKSLVQILKDLAFQYGTFDHEEL